MIPPGLRLRPATLLGSVLVLGATLWGIGITPVQLAAQGVGGLEGVERAMGRADFQEARALLTNWKAGDGQRATHGERERALWLEARLEVDPDRAEPLYRRLVLEYPGGGWSDQALQYLALLAESRGDAAARDRWFQTLVRDYPASPLRDAARQRLEGGTSMALGTGPVAEQGREMASSPGEGRYTLQAGAFSDPARARALEAELRTRGLSARVAQIAGSDLFRVRVGHFSTRELAAAEAQSLVARGLLPPDVGVRDDADQERRPG